MRRLLLLAFASLLGLALLNIAYVSTAAERSGPLITMTDPVELARLGERTAHFMTPGFQVLVARDAVEAAAARGQLLTNDPGRHPDPNACTVVAPCVGDPRLDDFAKKAGARVVPVLFTARSGATLSGHLWATRMGPAKRPLIVILNGSLIDFEQGHWPQAQSLAKAGYVVLTFDVQGEGASDQFGEGRDRFDSIGAGIPGTPHNGRPFYDGLVDALNFALSTPTHHYLPVPSSGSHTSHAAKQLRRVRAGLDAAYDPLWHMINRSEIGVAGYSYGAVAASYVAQQDRRIKAVVAWDNLCYPVQPSPDEVTGLFFSNPTTLLPGLTAPLADAIPTDCFGAPPGRPIRPRVPSLGISADFVLPGLIQSSDPGSKAAASRRYSRARVDSGQIVIQGGSHADFVFVGSLPLPATLRGLDMTIWYTRAWFDKYLRHQAGADRQLMSRQWQNDPATRAVDPVHDGNAFSQIFISRMDITLASGTRWDCENLRRGCPGSTNPGPPFDYATYVTR